MDALEIRLLAGFTVALDGKAITKFRSAKSRALLVWLACNPDTTHSRDTLATLLWGDSAEKAAKTNLRASLADLKKNLNAHPALDITRHDVTFHRAAATVDVTQLTDGLGQIATDSTPSSQTQTQTVAAALALYSGEFLAGFYLDDAPEFSDWQLATQENLHLQVMDGFAWLLGRYEAAANWTALAQTASQQLGLQPWHEPAHRYLIAALAEQGRWPEATEQYNRCRSVLFDEFGADPSAETQELWQLLNERFAVAAKPRHNLPQSLTPFFGRNEELNHINQALAERRYRLLTVTGLGGSGKTRLSLEVAQAQLPNFADGVWFVPLAAADSAESVLPTIATALSSDNALDSALDSDDKLLNWLAHKELLLILDNFEQLPDEAADRVLDLLQATQNVVILVTSRRRLGLRAETLFPIDGLAYPTADAPDDTLQTYDAVQFFAEQTKRINPRSQPELPILADICRLLRGLPLGIELTAAQSDRRSLAEIAATLQQNLAILETSMRDVPARQRSLRAVFDSSWTLLSDLQRLVLSRLSVFRGVFGDGAAVAVVPEATPQLLDALAGHSLLQRTADGNYRLHALVRQFSAENRPSTDSTPARHSRYFLDAISNEQNGAPLTDSVGDVRAAWQWIVAQRQLDQIQTAAAPFLEYMQALGRLRESSQLVEAAIKAVQSDSSQAVADRDETHARLISASSATIRRVEGLDVSIAHLQTALPKTQSPLLKSEMHKALAQQLAERGEWPQAVLHFEALEQIARDLGNDDMLVDALSIYAHNATLHFIGDYKQSTQRILEALAIVEKQGEAKIKQKMQLLNAIHNGHTRHGNYSASIETSQALHDLAMSRDNKWFIVTSLLNKGLASAFAGFAQQAIALNLEAIEVAREIDDLEGIGLLNANLCLSYRRARELETARRHGEIAIRQLASLNAQRMEGMARNRLSHTLFELGLVDEAHAGYAAAFKLWQAANHPNQFESQAGLAATGALCGDGAESLAHAQSILNFMQAGNLHKVVEPALMALNAATAFRELGHNTQANECITIAHKWMLTVAARNSEEVRQAYLNDVIQHQRLQTAFEKM